jgi:uncharacterized protein YoxC
VVILTEKEAKQYRELEALLKKVNFDIEKVNENSMKVSEILTTINKLSEKVVELNKRVQDLEVNKEINKQVTPKQILNELMGDEVPKINEEI